MSHTLAQLLTGDLDAARQLAQLAIRAAANAITSWTPAPGPDRLATPGRTAR